jgi:predicted transglutaminase-like cysteine proteinase
MRQAFFARYDRLGPAASSGLVGRLLRTALVGLPLIVGGATTEAQTLASLPSPSPAIEKNGGARPVAAWVDFCRRHPSECAVDTSEPQTIAMTPDLWRTILSTNRRVNARIKPKTDMEHWGVVDRWDLPDDGYGDCEDYQLLKRKLLAERGLPRRAMRMTVVIDDLGEGHAVLMIRTDRGDYILDNKTSAVLPWRDTGYTYVKREGQDSTAWVSLGGVGSPVATANR